MPLILLILVGAWFLFGSPSKTAANWFWPDREAPWETIDAFYYPNREDMSVFLRLSGLGNAQECRDWVFSMASIEEDPGMLRGDYECGVGFIEDFGGMSVYRLTVK